MADHFRDQMVDGATYFNLARQIQLSRFTRVFRTTVQPYGAAQSSQIDLYTLPSDPRALPWAVEVKNWQDSVTKPKVVHFWEAAQNLADDKGHGEMVCWFHARSGFTEPARKFMQEKGILSMDEATLAQMLRDFRVVERWREG